MHEGSAARKAELATLTSSVRLSNGVSAGTKSSLECHIYLSIYVGFKILRKTRST